MSQRGTNYANLRGHRYERWVCPSCKREVAMRSRSGRLWRHRRSVSGPGLCPQVYGVRT